MSEICILNIILVSILCGYGLSAPKLFTPVYGDGSDAITKHVALNQGRIYSILNWAVSPGGLGPRIKIWDWYSDNQSNFNNYGTGVNHEQCKPFTLSVDDYIIGYKVWADNDIYGLEFYTRNGNIYSCIGDSSKQTYSNSYNYDIDDFWYLTGWKIQNGAIIDQIQFQFTKSIPTNIQTSIPTIIPSKIPTSSPIIIPDINGNKLPYNITNGCVAKISKNSLYIFGGYTDMINDIYSEKTDNILVWNTLSFHNNRFQIKPLNIKPTSSINCHQNTVYSSIFNEIYIVGALSIYYVRGDDNDIISKHLIYVTSTYYVFNVSTLEYQLLSPDDSNGNATFIRSCTAINEDNDLLITFGGQFVNDFISIEAYHKNEFKLDEYLYSYNSTNILQIFNLSSNEWIKPSFINNAPLDAIESACIVIQDEFYVIGGKTIQNGEYHDRSEIMRYNILENEWNIITKLPNNMCYPKAFSITNDLDMTLLITGHQSCDINATYQLHIFNYSSLSIQFIMDLPIMYNIWNPMVEIVNESIAIFGGLERVKQNDRNWELTGNIHNEIWFNDSLKSVLETQMIPFPTEPDENTICDNYYDGYITTPIQIIHPCNDTDLIDLILDLLDVIEIIYNENGIIDVYITQQIPNKKYKYCGDSFVNIITCFHQQNEVSVVNFTSSPNFGSDILLYLDKNITIYVYVKNITVVYINNFQSTEIDIYNITLYDDVIENIKCVGIGNIDNYVFLILICIALFFAMLILIDLCHSSVSNQYHCKCCSNCGCYKSDTNHVSLLALMMLRICDMITDLILSIEIIFHYIQCNVGNPINLLFILSIASITCIAIPWFINVLTMIRISKLPNVVIERPTIYFKKYLIFYVFLVVISGSVYNSTMMISSNLLSLSLFNSGLNIIQYGSLRFTKVTTIIFENIPQVFIQFLYGYVILGDLNTLIILSLVFSLLSSLANSVSWCLSKNIDKKFEMIQYSLNIQLDQPEGADDIRSKVNEQLLQIKAYRGCKTMLKKRISAELKISKSKIDIGYVDILKDGCNIQIIQTIIDSDYEKEKIFSSIYTLYEDHCESIENIIKYVYHLQWEVELQVEFTQNAKELQDYKGAVDKILCDESKHLKMVRSRHQIVDYEDESSSDTMFSLNNKYITC